MTLEKTVLLSVLFHAVILAAISISIRKPYITLPPFEVSLVTPGGESVTIPKGGAVSAPRPASAPPTPRIEEKKPAMVANPEKVDRSAINKALARLRRSEALNERQKSLINSKLTAMQGIADVANRVKLKLEINKNKTGKAATAGAPGGSSTALGAYGSAVKAAINKNWFYPDVKTHGLQAVISIIILKDGTIVPKSFDKHSGNPLLDESAMRAIQRTGKLPPPPYAPLEIALGFTPD